MKVNKTNISHLKSNKFSGCMENLGRLLEHSADIIILINREGEIKYINPAAERILGYKPEELIGKPLFGFISPEKPDQLRDTVEMISGKKVPLINPIYIKIKHAKGSWIYLESILTDQLDNPDINGIVINSRDFTQHIAMQEALRDSRNFLTAIINNAGDPMYVKDGNQRWMLVNDAFCKFIGLKQDEILGKTDAEIFPKEGVDISFNNDTLAERKLANYEICFTDKNNKSRVVTARDSIYQDETGRNYIITILHDETGRKELEKEISYALKKEKELNEMRSNFISMISHEYRTPLTAILSSTELLELFGLELTEEEKQEHFERIKNSVDYMMSLVNDVLLSNRVESGGLEFNPSSFELISFCKDIVKNLIDNAKCKVELVSEPAIKEVVMDKKLLMYILANLLSNAVKYSFEGGTVEFFIRCSNDYVSFEIKDKGIGIRPEDHELLFEPFFRSTNVSHISGSGLGLPIVKKCVELHKGSIIFESSPGKGTKFIVRLPY